jgi:cyclomaltodextrinase
VLDLAQARQSSPRPDLAEVISRLARLRHEILALRYGDYRQLFVSHEQLAFSRQVEGQQVVVLLNASEKPAAFDLPIDAKGASRMMDLLNPGESFPIADGRLRVEKVWPTWARILVGCV